MAGGYGELHRRIFFLPQPRRAANRPGGYLGVLRSSGRIHFVLPVFTTPGEN